MKNIIITGTSRGIGYEMVALLAQGGHNVLALSRNAAPVSGLEISNCLQPDKWVLQQDQHHYFRPK